MSAKPLSPRDKVLLILAIILIVVGLSGTIIAITVFGARHILKDSLMGTIIFISSLTIAAPG